jgi:YggT family protein
MVGALLWLFNMVALLYILAVFAVLVLSWLLAFKVVDPEQPVTAKVTGGLFALTNPVLNPVRRIIPSIGGLDLSPVIVILLLQFIRRVVDSLVAG